MPLRIVVVVLPFFVVALAIAGVVAVDYSRSLRGTAAGEDTGFAAYAAARLDSLRGGGDETLADAGTAEATATPPRDGEGLGDRVKAVRPVVFSCTTGPGGSKVCSSID